MGIIMSKSHVGLGIAQGGAAIPENIQRLDEAKSRKELSNLKLAEYKQNAPLRQFQDDLAMQQVQNDLYTAQAKEVETRSFAAFDRYEGDSNVKHINNFLSDIRQNPIGKRMFADTVRYDAITRTPQIEAQLSRAGISDLDGFFNDPEAVGKFIVATRPDGTQEIEDLDRIYAGTGYTKHMQEYQLEQMGKRSLIQQRLRGGDKVATITAKERIARQMVELGQAANIPEAYQKLEKGSGSTQMERLAKEYQEIDPTLSNIDAAEKAIETIRAGSEKEREARATSERTGQPYDEAYSDIVQREGRTTAQKSFEEVETVKTELDKMFDGSFVDADLSDPKIRSKAGRLMARIEKDYPMSAADRADAVEIRQLASMGGTVAEEITEAEAGPLDSLLRNVSKYVSNNIKGAKGVAAYEAFRNTLRHALFGATQSVGETKNFNKAMGSMSEQPGPLLAKFRAQVEDLQSKLSGIYDQNDEYVAKYRLNMNLDQIAKVMTALDDRIEMFDNYKGSKLVAPTEGDAKTIKEYVDDVPKPVVKKTIEEHFKR